MHRAGKVRIVADERERASEVPAILSDMGARVDYAQLPVADYIVAADTAVERKSLPDFVGSIYDGRVFRQVEELRSQYAKPVLVVEGDLMQLGQLSRNPKAVYGAVAAIALESHVHLLFTADVEGTATALMVLAERGIRARAGRPLLPERPRKAREDDTARQLLYLVAALPGVGEVLALRLLRRFGTARRVFAASAVELAKVPGVGLARAHRIQQALTRRFEPARLLAEEQARLETVDDAAANQ